MTDCAIWVSSPDNDEVNIGCLNPAVVDVLTVSGYWTPACARHATDYRVQRTRPLSPSPLPPGTPIGRPGYVYVASSWRNPVQPAVVAALRTAGIDCYDFRNPPNGAGFGWEQVGGRAFSDTESIPGYLKMLDHPRAVEGFDADCAAMEKADTFVLVLPCGRSAHLELGWAVGAGKRTAILLDDPVTPELMYRMVDHIAPSLVDLLGWLGVEDQS